MTSGLGRIYAIAAAIVVFFLSWAIIAARPWVQAPEAKADHRLAALDQRERRLRNDAVAINAIVQKRWNVYHAQLVQRKHQIAARKKAQAAAARAVQIAQQQAAAQPAPSYYAAPSTSHAAPAPSAPIVRVAPPAAPPATHTKTS
jgi:ABC-type protease/lipase transport system fused ATPase/permease subunit